jgi:23S rRNA (uridine2552-2'-O)-methyltransferase|tara:strand:- start:903 stop:1589 length:687 start_codon:yes stop_codon:yes gene_type:complete
MSNNLTNNSRVKVKVKKGSKSVSSRRWLERQLNDPYVVAAKADGYRSRSAYKLLDLNDKFKFLKKGNTIIDLGAAPGGWSQVATKVIGLPKIGKLVSVDIQDMAPIEGVSFIKGSIMDEEIIEIIKKELECQADIVLSDMAPSASGHRNTDQTRALLLAELALDTAIRLLKKEGSFCCKLIRGKGEEELVKTMRRYFSSIKRYKPESSRKDSAEIFLIGLNFNDQSLA